VHGETALLAGVAQEIRIAEAVLGEESGFNKAHRVVFGNLRIADYRASIYDIAEHLRTLMTDAELRARMGAKGRERVVSLYDYRVVARQFVDYVRDKLGIQ
jgi:glycosyltransferase involved in cell wall biosynthesis